MCMCMCMCVATFTHGVYVRMCVCVCVCAFVRACLREGGGGAKSGADANGHGVVRRLVAICCAPRFPPSRGFLPMCHV
jgi:hypothetical protein